MSQMKEFTTAAEAVVEGEPDKKAVTFTIDGHEITAHPPREGQVAMMMARMGRHSSTNDKIAGLIDFFVETLDEEGHNYIVNRLLTRDDPFGIKDVTDVMTYLIEEWADRPTK